MAAFTRGDTASMPSVSVSRESSNGDGLRITVEWASRGQRHARVIDLNATDLDQCALSHIEQLDEQWQVKLFQHPRAGRREVLASLSSMDHKAFRGVKVVDRDAEYVTVEVSPDQPPQLANGAPTLRPFRSDLTALHGRRLCVLTAAPTDDRGNPQPLPPGVNDVVADVLGPGLTVRVIDESTGAEAQIAWDQLAYYVDGTPRY